MTPRPLAALAFALMVLPAAASELSVTESSFSDPRPSTDIVRRWNAIAVDASGLDHTPGQAGEQLGPGRSARAMAIVHIAIFDAANSLGGRYESFTGTSPAPRGTSVEAAVAQAAHDTLVAMFPSQRRTFDRALVGDMLRVRDHRARLQGMLVGWRAARAILAARGSDGSRHAEPRVGIDWVTGTAPGDWRQDPISEHPLVLGAFWGSVRPFVLQAGNQFRVPPPPALTSPEYAAAFDEVRRLGGDEPTTERTDDQTHAGIYWAYDGMPSLCAPPRLYNQVALTVAEQMGTTGIVETARLLALVNTAMADAGIAIWESKFFYDFWRPIGGIREADTDGNPQTPGDRTFSPLGAPASNSSGPNFTPPFPSYPSGHAGFGGALFQILRRFYRTDAIRFTFVSDEYNGVTVDNEGETRPLKPRTFTSLSQAEEENGQSRIYLGIHWAFDKTEGIAQGREVADWVFEHAFRPRRR